MHFPFKGLNLSAIGWIFLEQFLLHAVLDAADISQTKSYPDLLP